MAGGTTPRPRRGALQVIPIDLKSTRSEELRKVLALHDQATENRKQQPESTNNIPASRSQVIAGGRTNSRMKIRGGTFAPLAKDNFR
jgi:hypothetical protein